MIPTPYTLAVKRFSAGAKDAHGNAADTYAAPADWVVHGIAPGAMDEPGQANRDLSLIAFTVLAPANGQVPGERDLVTYGGVDYAVNGRPRDFSQGPWDFADAGVTVELLRSEG